MTAVIYFNSCAYVNYNALIHAKCKHGVYVRFANVQLKSRSTARTKPQRKSTKTRYLYDTETPSCCHFVPPPPFTTFALVYMIPTFFNATVTTGELGEHRFLTVGINQLECTYFNAFVSVNCNASISLETPSSQTFRAPESTRWTWDDWWA